MCQTRTRVDLPEEFQPPFAVLVNGVPQQPGDDYEQIGQTLYWLPRTAASSARLYWESLGDVTRWLEGPLEPSDRVEAPVGCTIFPHELQRPTRDEAAARFTDIRHWSEPGRGGHFPALEEPQTFAAELAAFFTLVR